MENKYRFLRVGEQINYGDECQPEDWHETGPSFPGETVQMGNEGWFRRIVETEDEED